MPESDSSYRNGNTDTEPKRLDGEKKIAHKFSEQTVSEILKQKKGGIKQAPLPKGSPSWDEFSQMTWEQIEAGAEADKSGFKVVRKLLADKRFDR